MGTEECRSCSYWRLGCADASCFCVFGRACEVLERDEWAKTKRCHGNGVERSIGSNVWRLRSHFGNFSILTLKLFYLDGSTDTNHTDPDIFLPCSILYWR